MAVNRILPARVNPLWLHAAERRQSLDGVWQFALDPDDRGLREGWPAHPERLRQTVRVPGSWQGQGHGDEGTDEVWDFRIRARVFRATYAGTGWYARAFTVPPEWAGQRLWLNFGGVHPSAQIWLNGAELGAHDLPFVPFAPDVTDHVHWAGQNDLVVRVHEHHREFGLAFNWQGNWSGLYRGVELSATAPAWLAGFRLRPEAETGLLHVGVELGGTPAPDAGALQVTVCPAGGGPPLAQTEAALVLCHQSPPPGATRDQGRHARACVAVNAPERWSPDAPHLYRVDVALVRDGQVLDARSERTGFVSLGTAGKHILINGQPTYLRGSGDFLSCPETGCPDTNRDRWRRRLRTLRAYGYNYIRCQSYVYGPEYYEVADEGACSSRARWACWAPGAGCRPCTGTSGPSPHRTTTRCSSGSGTWWWSGTPTIPRQPSTA